MYPKILYLHGIRGAGQRATWLDPLNSRLRDLGHNAVEAGGVIDPDYTAALSGVGATAQVPRVPVTWRRPEEGVGLSAKNRSALRAERMAARLKPMLGSGGSVLGGLDDVPIPPMEFWAEAKRYRDSESVRNLVWARIIEAVPAGEPIVIIGHSLGTVIAVDLIKRLNGNTVVLLATMGSPLGAVGGFRREAIREEFPYDRLLSWVNIYDPRDPVTGGRGVSEFFPAVVDAPIRVESSRLPGLARHDASAYAIHPIVAEILAESLLSQQMVGPTVRRPASRVAGREFLLLQMTYAQQLQRTIPGNAPSRYFALETARKELARLGVEASDAISESGESRSTLVEDDFLSRPADYVRGAWSDSELVPLAVALVTSWPVPPFEIETVWNSSVRKEALTRTLNRLRTPEGRRPRVAGGDSGEISDSELMRKVYDAVDRGRKEMMRGTVSWVPAVFVGIGIVTLAATGIGLAAVAPAGLAGAALITSTLAAFGPGGMVGGMVTLSVLSGFGAAAASGGAVGGAARKKLDLDLQNFLGSQFTEMVSTLPPEQLRATLAGIVAVVHAQEELGFTSSRELVRLGLHQAVAILSVQHGLHSTIAPGGKTTKGIAEKLDIARVAIAVMEEEGIESAPFKAIEAAPPGAGR